MTTCIHHWHPTFWDGSRYCETCELVEQETPRPPQKAGDVTSEAEERTAEIRAARAHPLTDADLASLELRIGWAASRSFDNSEVRRLVYRLRAAEENVSAWQRASARLEDLYSRRPSGYTPPTFTREAVVEAELAFKALFDSLPSAAPNDQRYKYLWHAQTIFSLLTEAKKVALRHVHWDTGPSETACGKSHRDGSDRRVTKVLAQVTCPACREEIGKIDLHGEAKLPP